MTLGRLPKIAARPPTSGLKTFPRAGSGLGDLLTVETWGGFSSVGRALATPNRATNRTTYEQKEDKKSAHTNQPILALLRFIKECTKIGWFYSQSDFSN